MLGCLLRKDSFAQFTWIAMNKVYWFHVSLRAACPLNAVCQCVQPLSFPIVSINLSLLFSGAVSATFLATRNAFAAVGCAKAMRPWRLATIWVLVARCSKAGKCQKPARANSCNMLQHD